MIENRMDQRINPKEFILLTLKSRGFTHSKNIFDYERAKRLFEHCEYYRQEDIAKEIARFIGV